MSNTDQFWAHAKEVLLLALSAESDDDRQSLLELAQTWTLAALLERRSCAALTPSNGPAIATSAIARALAMP